MVFVGFLIGGAMPWLFSSLAIKAVARAAGQIVQEVRKQFRMPGVMEGTVKPDYAEAVNMSPPRRRRRNWSTWRCWQSLTPIVVGLSLQVEALGGFLAGIILSGQLLAVFMSNAGGAWDNAKKLIEDEPRDLAKNTGKGSERHKAGVVGDTVGDPLKDTAGPALNPMIKVINLVSVIIAPIVVQYREWNIWVILAILICLGLVAWAIIRSRSGGSGFIVGAGEMAPIPAASSYVSPTAVKTQAKPAQKPAQKQGQKQGKR